MMIYMVKMIIGNPNNSVFIGLSRTFTGCVKCLEDVYPGGMDLERVSWSPTGILFRDHKNPSIFIHFMTIDRPWNGDIGWVITKYRNETRTEEIYALFDDKEKAERFIASNVDEPKYERKERCSITEVYGFIPFSKIIGDENPQLNQIHFTVYETKIK